MRHRGRFSRASAPRQGRRARVQARGRPRRARRDARPRATIFAMQIAIAQLDQQVGDLAGNARGDPRRGGRGRARGRPARRDPRALALRVPARGPAAAPGVPRRLRARARGAGRGGRAAAPRPPSVGFPETRTADAATTRSRCLPTVAWRRSTASSSCRTTRCSTRSAISSPAAACVVDVDGTRRGLLICEDVWYAGPARQAKEAGAQLPRRRQRFALPHAAAALRHAQVGARARETGLPFVYANRVGGQDELVFDGASFVMDARGDVVQQLPGWHEAVALASFDGGGRNRCAAPSILGSSATSTRRW